ncbi:MAG: class I SAM-dependent methyltransferase [Flavobacteriales bacterium]|nr:class I SAM-dependent methyltransferase [Flavobacteriales bacterium]
MEFLPEEIARYAAAHSEEEPHVLQMLSRETYQRVLMPRMMSGHLQGRTLSLFSRMMQPKRILEVGAYTGYSAICFAEGLAEGGVIDTVEVNDELNTIQDKYWELAGVRNKINRINGSALDILPTLTSGYDIIFLDADKRNYINYYEDCVRLLRTGGMLMVDNVLWSGKVVEEVRPNDVDTKVIMELNYKMQLDPRFFNVLLPIRDGIHIGMKLAD